MMGFAHRQDGMEEGCVLLRRLSAPKRSSRCSTYGGILLMCCFTTMYQQSNPLSKSTVSQIRSIIHHTPKSLGNPSTPNPISRLTFNFKLKFLFSVPSYHAPPFHRSKNPFHRASTSSARLMAQFLIRRSPSATISSSYRPSRSVPLRSAAIRRRPFCSSISPLYVSSVRDCCVLRWAMSQLRQRKE
jgi:hypothetical protein